MAPAAAGLLALAALLPAASPAEAASSSCEGATAKVRTAKVVKGGPGDDVLIGSGRSQRILAGGGNDLVCAGGGNDVVRGQSGDDVLHGDGRGDRLFGDDGADRLNGDILDDHLFGGPGADSLVGGHGVDKMFGGDGDDLLRGGTNRDCFYGEGGANVASFATATPPGVPEAGVDGVQVDLARPTRGACPRGGSGRADGDGSAEVLDGIQHLVGSAFGDSLRGVPGARVDAGLGDDSCPGFDPLAGVGCAGGEEKPPGTYAYVFEPATAAPPDPGLIVVARDGLANESIAVSGGERRGAASVAVGGDSLLAGPGCGGLGACAASIDRFGYVLVYGGDGADALAIGAGLDPGASVDLDGGAGDDALSGSDQIGEVLFGGDFPGADSLSGGGGADALVSEGGAPSSGPDALAGGSGDDQLVADYPCAGHSFSGGRGDDVAGFARAGVGIRAAIGGRVTLAGGRCPGGAATTVRRDNEVLEGTPKADRLTGSGGADTLWGREGDDVLVGLGGADLMRGFAGRDLIRARDGDRDLLIQCGSGRDRGAGVDRFDPRPVSC